MQFKDSAFIFVAGFILFVIGGFFNVFAIPGLITHSLAPSPYPSNNGAISIAILGSGLALTGLIQMSIGAYRALSRIDALPVPAVPTQVPSTAPTQA